MSGPQPFSWLPDAPGSEEGARDALEQNEAMQKAAAQAFKEQARLFYDVFQLGRGPELLEHLRDRTIEQPLLVINGVIGSMEIGLNPADWAFYREGQNSVIRYIETMIRTARQSEAEENQDHA